MTEKEIQTHIDWVNKMMSFKVVNENLGKRKRVLEECDFHKIEKKICTKFFFFFLKITFIF